MRTGRDVVRTIDSATRAARLSPVVAVRMANAGLGCDDLLAALASHAAGTPIRYGAYLDSEGTTRRGARNRKRNKAARAARKRNRG